MIYRIQTWRLGVKADDKFSPHGQIETDDLADAMALISEHPETRAGDSISLSDDSGIVGVILLDWHWVVTFVKPNPDWDGDPNDRQITEKNLSASSVVMSLRHHSLREMQWLH